MTDEQEGFLPTPPQDPTPPKNHFYLREGEVPGLYACSGCRRFAFPRPTVCYWCRKGETDRHIPAGITPLPPLQPGVLKPLAD